MVVAVVQTFQHAAQVAQAAVVMDSKQHLAQREAQEQLTQAVAVEQTGTQETLIRVVLEFVL